MPSRNIVKVYVKDGVYHIYNRGVEKRVIFQQKSDYETFLEYVAEYLEPPQEDLQYIKSFTLKGSTFKGLRRRPNNYHGKIELFAYCLMPNHFHLLLKMKDNDSIKSFLKSLLTRYSMYFNKKYNRVGPLFQGTYKAALVLEDIYLLHLSRYIHLNPQGVAEKLLDAYSSYADYLLLRRTNWLNRDFILSFFNTNINPNYKKYNSYKDFVENNKVKVDEAVGNLGIDNEL